MLRVFMQEWFYFLPDDSDSSITSALCFYNRNLVTSMYGIAAAGSGLLILMIARMVTNKQQLKRQSPNFLMNALICAVAIYRLSSPEEALLGYDFLFSFLIAQIFSLFAVTNAIFYNKFTTYLLRKMTFDDSQDQVQAELLMLHRGLFLITVTQALTYQFFWISVFPSKIGVRLKLVRSVFWLVAIQQIMWVVFITTVFTSLINDMELVLKNAASQVIVKSAKREAFESWLKRSIPKTKEAKKYLQFFSLLILVLCVLGGFWDWFTVQWTYMIPFIHIGLVITNLVVIWMKAVKSRTRNNNTDNNVSKFGSKSQAPSTSLVATSTNE